MAAVTIDLICNVSSSSETLALDGVRNAVTTELGVILADLELDAGFRIDVRAESNSHLQLYVDGTALPPEDGSAVEIIRAHLAELITARFIDHSWRASGGRSVAPPAFQDLVRALVRHRVRPN